MTPVENFWLGGVLSKCPRSGTYRAAGCFQLTVSRFMLIRLFQQAPICGVGLGLADWIGPPVSHLLIGRGLAPRPEPKQNLERLRRLLGPTMAKDGLIKTGLEQIPAHETRARFSESLGTACPYTTNWGLLKQPDKHESLNRGHGPWSGVFTFFKPLRAISNATLWECRPKGRRYCSGGLRPPSSIGDRRYNCGL